LRWYDAHARDLPWRVSPRARATGVRPDPYRVWLSEIMLQQTGTGTVAPYYARFLEQWPNVHRFAAAPLDHVLAAWAGLGYYARARNVHACARIVCEQFAGKFPQNAENLEKLPGIGPYTSAAIAAICHDEPVAAIDGNVERVVARLLALSTPKEVTKTQIRVWIEPQVPVRAGDFAQAMMDLGATICTPKIPKCPVCPLKAGCIGLSSGDPTRFPVRAPRKARPKRYGHVFVLTRADGAVWIRKRSDTGLLAHMSEVPGSDWGPATEPPAWPFRRSWRPAGTVRHVFTHFSLELEVWRAGGKSFPARFGGAWVSRADIAHLALPTLYKKVLRAAEVVGFSSKHAEK